MGNGANTLVNNFWKIFLSVWFYAISTNICWSHIDLDTSYMYLDDGNLPVLIDRNHTVTTDNLLSQTQWDYNPNKFDYSTDLGAYVWLKLHFRSKNNPKRYVLHLYNGLIPDLKVYRKISSNALELIDSLGSTEIQAARAIHYRDPIIELPYSGGEEIYYVRVHAQYYHGFDMAIRSFENIYNYTLSEYYLLGAFYGILILILLYNIFLFIQLKEILYLYYAVYVFIAIVSSSSTDLTGYNFFWPNHPEWNKFLIDQSKWMISAAFVFYGINFLQLKTLTKKWFWITSISSATYIIYNFLVINIFVPTIVSLFLAILFLHLIIFWISAWKSFSKGNKSAGIFMIGLSLMVMAFAGNYLRYWELITVNVATSFILHYGILAEIIVLTYAMSYRYRLEKEAKVEAYRVKMEADQKLVEQFKINDQLRDKVQRELEEKVAQRTTALQLANEQLNQQALKMNEINAQLSKLSQNLYKEKKQQQRARVWKKNLTIEEFFEIFPTKESCYRFIQELKENKIYSCTKCKHDIYIKGVGFMARRCPKCGYNESITTATIFKGAKSPIQNMFYALYLLFESNHQISATEIATKSEIGIKVILKLKKDIETSLSQKKSQNWVDYVLI